MKKWFLPAVFLLANFFSYSQEYAFSVQHLNVEDGLSSRFVNSIFQDSKGFIWFATSSGADRWDGTEMKGYAGYSQVNQVMEDSQGRIWFQYKPRDNAFLERPDKFHINHSPINSDTLLASDWQILSNLKGTLLLRSLDDGQIYTYTDQLNLHANLSSFFESNVMGDLPLISPVSKDRFWLMESETFTLLDLEGTVHDQEKLSPNFRPISEEETRGDTLFYSLVKRKNDREYAYSHFFKELGQDSKPNPQYEKQDVRQVSLSEQRPPFFKKTKNGLTWERKMFQLLARDQNGKVIFDFYDHLGYTQGCPHFLLDEQDNAWISTQNGLYRITIIQSPFQSYLKDGNPGYSTRGILLLQDSLYVHSYKGSKLITLKDGTVRPLKNTPEDIGYGVGNFLDKGGILYWGEGRKTTLSRYNLKTQELQQIAYQHPSRNTSYLPYRDQRSGTMWFSGTEELCILREDSLAVIPFKFDSEKQPVNIRHFVEDEKGLWIVARNGLFLVDPIERKILNYYGAENGTFPFDQFNYLHKDKDGTFWLATQGFGLLHWNPNDNSYEFFNRKNGFISPIIYTIYEDQNNRLWLPTEYGLVLFNKTKKTTRVFLEQDGISHNEFNGFSHHKGHDGRLYFGGLNGIIAFHPDSILTETPSADPPLYITSVKLLDTRQDGILLDKTEDIISNKKLELTPDNQSFTIQFALLDFNSQPNVDYAYKIDGLDKEWTYQNSNKIRFNALPSGNYTLKIKAKGNSGFWSANQINLPIKVIKPYYFRWPFLLGSLILVSLLYYAIFRYRTIVLQQDARKLEKQVALRTQTIEQQKDDLELMTQAKDRLYGIIAHDLRDPVESFRGLNRKIKYLVENKDIGHVLKLTNFVEKSAEELSKLLENLLDWARHQQKELPFAPSSYNIENLVKEVFGSLQIFATNKSIKLVYEGDPGLEVYGDYNMLTTIFRNLIDNALKYSHPDSIIKVEASYSQNKTLITLQDFGIGMKSTQLNNLFKVKNKHTSEGTLGERGTGLGMPLCKELLDSHNAEVQIRSIIGEGTKVSIFFLEKSNE